MSKLRSSKLTELTDSVRLLAQAALLNTAAEGVAMVDSEGRYVFVNQRLAQILARRPEEVLGRHVIETVEEARAGVQSALARRRGGLIEQLDVPLLRPDGSVPGSSSRRRRSSTSAASTSGPSA